MTTTEETIRAVRSETCVFSIRWIRSSSGSVILKTCQRSRLRNPLLRQCRLVVHADGHLDVDRNDREQIDEPP